MFRQLLDDVRHAGRAVLGMPLLASVVILSLAVGIGVNAIVFSWVQALVWQPLPGVRAASDVVLIEPRTETGARPGASWPEYEDLRQRLEGVTELVAFRMAPLTVGVAPRNERAYGLLVSDNYFEVLGLRPAAGRFPSRDGAVTGRGGGRGRRLVRLLADPAGRRRVRDRAAAAGERPRADRGRRDAGRISGHGARPAVRCVGAGGAGAARVQRIAGARQPRQPRLLPARATRRPARVARRPRRPSTRRCAISRRDIPSRTPR